MPQERSQIKRLYRVLCRAACAFSVLFIVLTWTPVEKLWIVRLESAWPDRIPPVLLVLAADEQDPGFVGYSTYLRVNYAARYWRTGNVRSLIVSGGPGKAGGTVPLAWAMRDYLVGQGVPANAILVDSASSNTRENFLNTRGLLSNVAGENGFLTSDFHSGRAARVAARLGLHNIVPVPIPDAGKRWNQWGQRWPIAFELAEETAKWIWYAWKGWI